MPHNTWADVVLDGVRYDDIGAWASGSPSRLTVTAGGLHIVSAALAFATNTTGGRHLRITDKTGRYEDFSGQLAVSREADLSGGTLVNPATGDWFSMGGFQNSGAALNTIATGEYGADLTLARCPAGSIGARREATVAQGILGWTTLTFSTTLFDTGGLVGGAGLIAPSDGMYAMFAGAYMPSANYAGVQGLAILVDGKFQSASMPAQATTTSPGYSVATMSPLVAGQLITAQAFQTSSRNTDVAVLRPYLAAVRLGPA